MYRSFDQIGENSRVWIYQLDRPLTQSELDKTIPQLENFCNQWQAHGAGLLTSYQLFYNQFLILAVDEAVAGASGCSIDGSVRSLQNIIAGLGVDFFNRTQVAFLIHDKIELYPLTSLKELFANGTLNATDITFNNLVATKGELANNWEVKVSDSWLAKYLPKKALA